MRMKKMRIISRNLHRMDSVRSCVEKALFVLVLKKSILLAKFIETLKLCLAWHMGLQCTTLDFSVPKCAYWAVACYGVTLDC